MGDGEPAMPRILSRSAVHSIPLLQPSCLSLMTLYERNSLLIVLGKKGEASVYETLFSATNFPRAIYGRLHTGLVWSYRSLAPRVLSLPLSVARTLC
jgi:hypothetical protein